jgi:hypothetical protein
VKREEKEENEEEERGMHGKAPPSALGEERRGWEETHTTIRKSTTTFQRATNTRRSLRLRSSSNNLVLRPSEGSSNECSFDGLEKAQASRQTNEQASEQEGEEVKGHAAGAGVGGRGVQFEVENRGAVHDQRAGGGGIKSEKDGEGTNARVRVRRKPEEDDVREGEQHGRDARR